MRSEERKLISFDALVFLAQVWWPLYLELIAVIGAVAVAAAASCLPEFCSPASSCGTMSPSLCPMVATDDRDVVAPRRTSQNSKISSNSWFDDDDVAPRRTSQNSGISSIRTDGVAPRRTSRNSGISSIRPDDDGPHRDAAPSQEQILGAGPPITPVSSGPPTALTEPEATADKGASRGSKEGVLSVRVLKALQLTNAEKGFIGRTDPFALVTVGPESKRTKTVINSLNPLFSSEVFVFDVHAGEACVLEALDANHKEAGDDLPLGKTTINFRAQQHKVWKRHKCSLDVGKNASVEVSTHYVLTQKRMTLRQSLLSPPAESSTGVAQGQDTRASFSSSGSGSRRSGSSRSSSWSSRSSHSSRSRSFGSRSRTRSSSLGMIVGEQSSNPEGAVPELIRARRRCLEGAVPELDQEQMDAKRLELAATKIQALARGRLARQNVRGLRLLQQEDKAQKLHAERLSWLGRGSHMHRPAPPVDLHRRATAEPAPAAQVEEPVTDGPPDPKEFSRRASLEEEAAEPTGDPKDDRPDAQLQRENEEKERLQDVEMKRVRKFQEQKDAKRLELAATKIQALARGRLARQTVRGLRLLQQEDKAQKLRAEQVRKQRQSLRSSQQKEQRDAKQKRGFATLRLQSWVRGIQASAYVAQLRGEKKLQLQARRDQALKDRTAPVNPQRSSIATRRPPDTPQSQTVTSQPELHIVNPQRSSIATRRPPDTPQFQTVTSQPEPSTVFDFADMVAAAVDRGEPTAPAAPAADIRYPERTPSLGSPTTTRTRSGVKDRLVSLMERLESKLGVDEERRKQEEHRLAIADLQTNRGFPVRVPFADVSPARLRDAGRSDHSSPPAPWDAVQAVDPGSHLIDRRSGEARHRGSFMEAMPLAPPPPSPPWAMDRQPVDEFALQREMLDSRPRYGSAARRNEADIAQGGSLAQQIGRLGGGAGRLPEREESIQHLIEQVSPIKHRTPSLPSSSSRKIREKNKRTLPEAGDDFRSGGSLPPQAWPQSGGHRLSAPELPANGSHAGHSQYGGEWPPSEYMVGRSHAVGSMHDTPLRAAANQGGCYAQSRDAGGGAAPSLQALDSAPSRASGTFRRKEPRRSYSQPRIAAAHSAGASGPDDLVGGHASGRREDRRSERRADRSDEPSAKPNTAEESIRWKLQVVGQRLRSEAVSRVRAEWDRPSGISGSDGSSTFAPRDRNRESSYDPSVRRGSSAPSTRRRHGDR